MPNLRMSADDRLDVLDPFARYAWSYDTGDAKGMAALFTEDGVMEGTDGRRFQGRAAIAGFCREFIGGAEFRGTQHRCGATPDMTECLCVHPLSARRSRAS